MSGENFKCTCCNYFSNKKYNLYRHMVAKHVNSNVGIIDNEFNNANIDIINANNQNKVANNNINYANSEIDFANNNKYINENKCYKCSKILSSKHYLNKHLLICKGVLSALICPICNKIFAHRNSKLVHLKSCKEKQLALVLHSKEEDKQNELLAINNNDIVINENQLQLQPQQVTNNIVSGDMINNNINNITYNINLVSYNKEDEKIEFDSSHLKLNELEHKIRTRDPDSSFKLFCDKLFENKNNQMIIKSNLRNKYSNIHLGMNIWEKILDNYIYPIIMSHIAEQMIIFFNTNNKKSKQLDDYLQIMASLGYSNCNTSSYKNKYKKNIEQLKLLFNTFN